MRPFLKHTESFTFIIRTISYFLDLFFKNISLVIPHLYNTSDYVEHWQKTKKEELPREIKTGVVKLMCFTYRRHCGVLYFNRPLVSPAVAPYVLAESTTASGFHYCISLTCSLQIRSSISGQGEQREVANDKNQIVNTNSSNLVTIWGHSVHGQTILYTQHCLWSQCITFGARYSFIIEL